MATAVQLTLTMDNSGVVTVANQTGSVLQKIPPPSPKIKQEFDGIESSERRAHIAGTLFTRLTGFELPKAMETVISRSRVLGPLLAGMFNASIVATAGFAVIEFGKKLGGLFDSIMGNTEAVKALGKAAADAAQDAFWNPKTLSVAIDHLGQLQQRVAQLRKESQPLGFQVSPTASIGTGDVARISPEIKAEKELEEIETRRRDLIENITKLQVERNSLLDAETAKANEAGKQGFALLEQQRQDYLNSRTLLVLKTQDYSAYTEQVALKERQFQGERTALERESTNQTIALRHQVAEESVQGTMRVHMIEADAIDDINRREKASLITRTNAQEQRVLIHQRAAEQIRVIENGLLKQDDEARLFAEQRANAFLTGSQKIIADAQYEKDQIEANVREVVNSYTHVMAPEAYNAWKNAQIKIQAITESTTRQLILQQQQLRDKTIDLQQQAAIGALPEWQRAEATIRLEHDKTYQELNRLEIQDAANFAIYEQQKAAADQLMNDHLRDEHKRLTESLGSDLQSVFDDITSGNIGKRILSNMEKLFFQILAQWILSLNIMKSAAGSIFGSIVFGPGSTGAGVFGGGGQGGGSSLLGGILGGLFGGGSSSESKTVGFGGSSGSFALPGLVGATPSGLGGAIAGTGATANSALVPSASNALTSSTMSAALPGLVGGTTAQLSGGKTSLFGGLLSKQGLASIAPLAAMLLGSAGGKVGMAGGILGSLVLSGHLAPLLSSLYGTIGLGATGALVGGAVGGLLGFGIGSSHGGFLGSLAGAGSGALTGFMVGGPVGAIVGGLIGLLGGIFGGIFGGAKRKKQANALADNTILPDITQIITGFDGFQVDSSSAIQQLEQLRTDAQKQLNALKSQGKDVFNQKVGPAIDSAEKHIRDTQSERDRRSSLVFGPPQFDTGGLFRTMRGNAGLAVLHDGEMVINPTATKKNADTLARINAGGSAGGSHIEVHIHPDTFDRHYVKSQQFEKDITTALNRASAEGRW